MKNIYLHVNDMYLHVSCAAPSIQSLLTLRQVSFTTSHCVFNYSSLLAAYMECVLTVFLGLISPTIIQSGRTLPQVCLASPECVSIFFCRMCCFKNSGRCVAHTKCLVECVLSGSFVVTEHHVGVLCGRDWREGAV